MQVGKATHPPHFSPSDKGASVTVIFGMCSDRESIARRIEYARWSGRNHYRIIRMGKKLLRRLGASLRIQGMSDVLELSRHWSIGQPAPGVRKEKKPYKPQHTPRLPESSSLARLH